MIAVRRPRTRRRSPDAKSLSEAPKVRKYSRSLARRTTPSAVYRGRPRPLSHIAGTEGTRGRVRYTKTATSEGCVEFLAAFRAGGGAQPLDGADDF